MRGQFLRRRLPRASGDGNDRFSPIDINFVSEGLQCFDRVINKDQFVFERREVCTMFFKSIGTDDARNGAFFEGRWNVLRCVLKLSVESVVLILWLRQR